MLHTGQRGSFPFFRILAVIVGVLWAVPAQAQEPPEKSFQDLLIKTTLLTFNDANGTGNYTVLHAKLSKQFRDQFSPERLKEVFAPFRDKKIDIKIISIKAPISSKDAQVDDRGILTLVGHFDTTPNQVHFDLGYIISEGEWKPIKINVDVRPPGS